MRAVLIKPAPENMKNHPLAFNIILMLATVFLGACKTGKDKEAAEATFLRLHLETNRDGTQHNSSVPVYRAKPMLLNVERNASLDEGFMKKAEVVDVDEFGGFAIRLIFNDTGKQRLDYLTTANKGRRLGIHARWTEDRWLGAPIITRRIDDGIFIFTPDASREEADRIVEGLENVIKKLNKPYTF
jgi:hypothetical protein